MSEWYGTTDLARDLGLTPAATRRLLRSRGLSAGRGGRYRWPRADYRNLLQQVRADTTMDGSDVCASSAIGEQPREEDGTLDESEVRAFSAIAGKWWDEDGPLSMLHRLNPVRLAYIRRQFIRHFDLDGEQQRPLEGLAVLDVGCGGGLVSEPLARLGATMTGLDASSEAIAVARQHATRSGLTIDWRQGTIEDMARNRPGYDALVALEIIEHVSSVEAFVAAAVRSVRPGGLMIFSTINRTPRSLVLAKFMAEYVARLVPRGTHDAARFVRPVELVRLCRRRGARVSDVTGLVYDVIDNRWRLSPDSAVNYIAVAVTAR